MLSLISWTHLYHGITYIMLSLISWTHLYHGITYIRVVDMRPSYVAPF